MPAQLVIFEDNYADEFDVEGFRVFTSKEELDTFLSETEKLCIKIINRKKTIARQKVVDHYRETSKAITDAWKVIYDTDKTLARNKSYSWYEVYGTTEEKFVEEKTKYYSAEIEVGFGTNEWFTFSSFEDYRRSLTIRELDYVEYEVMKGIFGTTHGGVVLDEFTFNEFPDILQSYEDFDDEPEE